MKYTLYIKGKEPFVSKDYAECMNKAIESFPHINVSFYTMLREDGEVCVEVLRQHISLLGKIKFNLNDQGYDKQV